jgi:hypothetical protein
VAERLEIPVAGIELPAGGGFLDMIHFGTNGAGSPDGHTALGIQLIRGGKSGKEQAGRENSSHKKSR